MMPRTLRLLSLLLAFEGINAKKSAAMAEESTIKRRRLDEKSPTESSRGASNVHPLFSPIDLQTAENIDPFLSPATASSWPFDEFAHDPDYLASQEALRSLMFDTARSVAPTREGTPLDDDVNEAIDVKNILANGRHIQYLKNYLSSVAPWVSQPQS